MFKVKDEDTRRTRWRRPDIFVVNFEHVSSLALVCLLLTLSMYLFAGPYEYITA